MKYIGFVISVANINVAKKFNNVELAFEQQNFDSFMNKLKEYSEIDYLGNVIEYSWGQRVIRFYDLVGHLIEVGENMKMVIERFLNAGMTIEEVSVKMDIFIEDLGKRLNN